MTRVDGWYSRIGLRAEDTTVYSISLWLVSSSNGVWSVDGHNTPGGLLHNHFKDIRNPTEEELILFELEFGVPYLPKEERSLEHEIYWYVEFK